MRLSQGPLILIASDCMAIREKDLRGSVIAGTEVLHLVTICIDQFTKTLCICVCAKRAKVISPFDWLM